MLVSNFCKPNKCSGGSTVYYPNETIFVCKCFIRRLLLQDEYLFKYIVFCKRKKYFLPVVFAS